jgi:hypothetical protein
MSWGTWTALTRSSAASLPATDRGIRVTAMKDAFGPVDALGCAVYHMDNDSDNSYAGKYLHRFCTQGLPPPV